MSRLRFVGLLIAVLGAALARAHDPGISTAQGELRADVLNLTTGFSPVDIEQLLPSNVPRAERWGPGEFELARDFLQALAQQLWEVRRGDAVVKPRETKVELLPGDNVSFQWVFPLPSGGDRMTLRATKLADLPAGHRQFVIISDEHGFALAKKLLSARDGTVEVPLGAVVEKKPTTVWAFVGLGVEHIWTGYDHLLFLFALLVVCRSFRSIAAIVSCFTLAHSLTLALATLNVVNLPSRLVEAAIAASIVYVGAENLLRRGAEPRGRWALTFAFGLVHGFGFASVLRDLGVGSGAQGIAMPLFTFNLGVEVGQIAIASVVLPIVWQMRKSEAFVRRGVPVFSGLVTIAGLYWLVQRTFFS